MKSKIYLAGLAVTLLITLKVSAQITLSTSVINASCFGACDGFIDLTVSGGTIPYTYQWNNAEIIEDIGGCAGNYSVTVTDAVGSTATTNATIIQPTAITVSVTSTNATCSGDCNGFATATASGGTPPYIYMWNDPMFQTSTAAFALCAGVYTVSVTDNNGCLQTSSIFITEPNNFSVSLISSSVSCQSCCDGSASATSSGGMPPYTYMWSNGASANAISNLCAGLYCTTVTDANGCTAYGCTNVTDSACSALNLSANSMTAGCTGCTGIAFATANGGVSPYTFIWNTTPSQNNDTLWGLCTGTYMVSVYDSTGCLKVSNINIGCVKNRLEGKLYHDINENCVFDSTDYSLYPRPVTLNPGNKTAFTNSNGEFYFLVDSGTYIISVTDNDLYRDQLCPASPSDYTVSVGNIADTVANLDFSYKSIMAQSCPDLTVSIYNGNLRPCFDRYYNVSYMNNGTASSSNTIIIVELDSNLTYISGGNLIAQSGNSLTFDIGTVNPNQSGYFYFTVLVNCDLSIVNRTLCVTAHIYPDSSCLPVDSTWDRSSVSVEGYCFNDSLACFTIYNTGDPGNGDMDGASQYRLYSNNVLVSSGNFQLNGGDSTVICFPATGNTLRLEADQRPGHPGNSHPQANVENCGGPPVVNGQINGVAPDDADDFIEIICSVVTNSWDPNDKNVSPEGLTSSHFIDSTDLLEYSIHFQNTGSDTAYKVIVIDTLSPYLDISTLQQGSSSHGYTFDVFDGNVVQWAFNNIMLPDSSTDEPASNGFVSFKVNQYEGNPEGTIIVNYASIFFDFNPPVITNTVFNTIGNIDSITGDTSLILFIPVFHQPEFQIYIYPNPLKNSATVKVKPKDENEKNNLCFLKISDLIGREVETLKFIGNQTVFERKNLTPGIYIYKIFSNEILMGSGKIIVMD